jgi:hypothetical protein
MGVEPPHRKFKPRAATAFLEGVADVTFHGADANHKSGRDGPIAKPLQKELDHGGFCGGEALLSHDVWRCFQNHSPLVRFGSC